jgi:Mg2+/Co2+ transporter CorB
MENQMSFTGMILILIALVLTSVFFSASEIGMISINRYRLRHLVRLRNRSAKLVNKMLQRPDQLLAVILIGNTFANTFAASVATLIAQRYYGESSVAVVTLILTLVILIFGEIAPKSIAAINPQRVAFKVVWPLQLLLWVLLPLVWAANFIVNNMLRLVGIEFSKQKAEHLNHEELRTVVLEAGSMIPSAHRNMLLSIFDLEKMTVEEVMVVRNEISGLDLNQEWDNIIQDLKNAPHTRLPIYDDDINHVIGVLHLRDVMGLLTENRLSKEKIRSLAVPAYFIPEGTPLNTQLLNFKKNKIHSGFVVDEYGDIQGLVTLEDILEEIVGEFSYDIDTITRDIHPQADGTFLVDGGISLRELNRLMNWNLPQQGPKTLSGLIIEHLEHIPPASICVRIGGYPIEVVQVKDNMVKTARILPALRAHE